MVTGVIGGRFRIHLVVEDGDLMTRAHRNEFQRRASRCIEDTPHETSDSALGSEFCQEEICVHGGAPLDNIREAGDIGIVGDPEGETVDVDGILQCDRGCQQGAWTSFQVTGERWMAKS